MERAVNLCEAAREGNWANRSALLELGVKDSILQDSGLSAPPPDDDDLLDTNALDLAELGNIVKRDQEGRE